MARRAPVRRTFRAPQQRAATDWTRFVPALSIVVPAASKVLSVSLVLSNPGIGETIRRTRGIMSVASDQEALYEEPYGAFGAIVVNDVAAGVGVASLPDPVTESSDDGWFLWQPFLSTTIGLRGGSVAGSSQADRLFEFDSKAMRRVEEGFQIAFVVANGSATHGMRFGATISVLTSRQ